MTLVSDPEFDTPDSDDAEDSDHDLVEADVDDDPAIDEDTDVDHDDDDDDDELAGPGPETPAEFVDRELGHEPEQPADDAKDTESPEPEAEIEAGAEAAVETEAPDIAESAPAPIGSWTGRQAVSVLQRALAVAVLFGLIGYGLGFSRGPLSTARAEFVYTLDESVPDSFLREDRRLLTQVVTFESDAVLTPVGRQFDLTADQLRAKIDVGTVNLSEFLHLDVTDADPDRAVAINRAVLDQYLRVIAGSSPAVDSSVLEETRAEIATQLTEADAERLALAAAGQRDAVLEAQQESLQRRIDTGNQRINLLRQSLDTAQLQGFGDAQTTALANTLAEAEADQVALETQLVATVSERAELETATTAEPALLREIGRLETKLATVDDELADRELAPLIASPIRELSDPIIEVTSRHLFGLQGMAIGLLLATPVAGLVGYRARRRQLWSD